MRQVHAAGALLVLGDGHARQGDGECCGTALETSLSGAVRLTVLKSSVPRAVPASSMVSSSIIAPATPLVRANHDAVRAAAAASMGVRAPLARPRAESPSALITLACAARVDDAASHALEEMLAWLAEVRPRLARADAYLLLSVAADVRITQLVNGTSRGCHCVLEKRCLPPADREEETTLSGDDAVGVNGRAVEPAAARTKRVRVE